MKIITEGLLEGISTRVDGSIAFKFATQELDPQHAADLFRMRHKYCKILLSDSNISSLEAELVDSAKLVGNKKKTPSQRLRAVMFLINEQEKFYPDFENYYNQEMEKLITHYKTKLP